MNVRRGYIAMLAVRKEYRKLKIGTTLVTKAIEVSLCVCPDNWIINCIRVIPLSGYASGQCWWSGARNGDA